MNLRMNLNITKLELPYNQMLKEGETLVLCDF